MTFSPTDWSSLHDGRLVAMIEIATAAGNHTLRYFQSESLSVDAKLDDSPVTVADREAEQLARELIKQQFPDDAVQGEELEDQSGTNRYRWVIDPIDGTKSFVCGVPLYSTLLALEVDDQPLGGVILIPALQEIVAAAVGQRAWYRRGDRAWQRATVSSKTELSKAVFVTTEVATFELRGAADVYRQIERQAWLTRTWGDGYGYLLVATGRADIMIDPICNAWDVAAILPVVTEAGGRFSDWRGAATARGGDGLGTNGNLHEAALACLK